MNTQGIKKMNSNYDSIIIGNGAIGCASAIRLAQKSSDLRIALVGNFSRQGAASVAAGYMLNLFAELDAGYLERSEYARQRFELARLAKTMWPAWAKTLSQLSSEPIKLGMGTYVINNSSATHIDDKNYDYILASLEAFNEPHEEIDPRDIQGFKPNENHRALRALYIKEEGFFQSASLFRCFDQALRALPNIELIDANAVDIKLEGADKKIHLNNTQVISSPMVLLCAGAYTQSLIEKLPSKPIPRIFFGTGTGVHLQINDEIPDFRIPMPNGVIRTTNRGNACGIHVVPYGKNQCYVGASNLVTKYCEPAPRMAALHGLLESAMDQINTDFYKSNITPIMGHRPTSADIYPVLGKVDSIDGLWIATGTKRDGLFLSPLISDSISNEMLECGESKLPEVFKPERKLIYDLKRDQAIEANVLDVMSGLHQHHMVLPKAGIDSWMASKVREDIQSVYDKLGIHDVGIPSELLNMYRYGHIQYQPS